MGTKYTYGLRIEGIGDTTTKTEGIAFCFGAPPTGTIATGSDFEWLGGLTSSTGLVTLPAFSTASTDTANADYSSSSGSFVLYYDEIAASKFSARNARTSLAIRTTALNTTSTNVLLSGLGNTGKSGDVIWVDDEAILLGTDLGSGQYSSCTRGMYGTTAQRHAIGAAVYTRNPFVRGRVMSFVRIDRSDGTEVVQWRGVLDSVKTDSTGTRLLISGRSVWAALRSGTVNRNAVDINQSALPFSAGFVEYKNGPNKDHLYCSGQAAMYLKQVNKSGDDQHKIAFQVGNVLTFPDWDGYALLPAAGKVDWDSTASTNVYQPSRVAHEWPDGAENLNAEGRVSHYVANLPPDARCTEVLAIIRELDELGDDARHGTEGDYYSATRDLNYPFHPLAIAMALYTSTSGSSVDTGVYKWDCFTENWGLGLPLELFDATSIGDLITATSYIKIDQLVLGWDGEPVNVNEVVKELCRTYGFARGETTDGKMTFFQVKSASIADYAAGVNQSVRPQPFTLEWIPNANEGVDVIRGTIGKSPWFDGQPYTAQALNASGVQLNSPRASFFVEDRELTLDMRTRTSAEEALINLLTRITTGHLSTPQLRILVNPSDDASLGDIIALNTFLESQWFVDPATGSRYTPAANSLELLGLVVARRPLHAQAEAVELTLELRNYHSGKFGRYRAPSAVVTSYTSSQVTVSTDYFTSDDPASFEVGQRLTYWRPYGGKRTTAGYSQITGISGDIISITNTGLSGGTPQAGDIIRLANYDDHYVATGNPSSSKSGSGTYQEFCYMADANDEQLGDDGDAAHVYGDAIQ